jgi:hypothetical protein
MPLLRLRQGPHWQSCRCCCPSAPPLSQRRGEGPLHAGGGCSPSVSIGFMDGGRGRVLGSGSGLLWGALRGCVCVPGGAGPGQGQVDGQVRRPWQRCPGAGTGGERARCVGQPLPRANARPSRPPPQAVLLAAHLTLRRLRRAPYVNPFSGGGDSGTGLAPAASLELCLSLPCWPPGQLCCRFPSPRPSCPSATTRRPAAGASSCKLAFTVPRAISHLVMVAHTTI